MDKRPRRHNPIHIRKKPYKTLEEAFWERVYIPQDLMQCWLWLGSTNGRYGKIVSRLGIHRGKDMTFYAHRVAYEIFYGSIPPEQDICHDCPEGDNPLCVNPRHLFMGTAKDNLADMRRKGRHKHATLLIKNTRQVTLAVIAEINEYRAQAKVKVSPEPPSDPRRKLRKPLDVRFWEKVQKSLERDGCWLWTGYKTDKGYGQITLGRQGEGLILAHRLSYILHNGPILPTFEVLHNCPTGDNPSCVNPKHLRLGTHADNMADAAKKGMMEHGEHRYNSRLTVSMVQEIRRLYHEEGLKQVDLVRKFGLSPRHINKIVHHKIWRHC